ncbi:MAG: helix-turn-helix domain-containing protein [Candidatus Paceibacterota bacterium]
MLYKPLEAYYPVEFRRTDAKVLCDYIKLHQSVQLIGMKRVGISNFLRYFLYSDSLKKKYFKDKTYRIFVPIDLNDLIECEIYPFWLLTFKRLVDVVDKSKASDRVKVLINGLFDKSIQTQDYFLTVDSIRTALVLLVEKGYVPILFFVGFDRLLDAFTTDFFSNLRGLRDATHKKLVYVFTSYRDLCELNSEVFDKNTVSVFSTLMYLRPAQSQDSKIICASLEEKYNLNLSKKIRQEVISLAGGHVQYLQLSVIAINEYHIGTKASRRRALEFVKEDERITLQSEELYSNLTKHEQSVLTKIALDKSIPPSQIKKAHYLWETGMVEGSASPKVFSPYMIEYLRNVVTKQKTNSNSSKTFLTGKEHALFQILKEHEGDVCERDVILSQVWAEYSAIGVSDWAIDRLVARLRKKLKQMDSDYSIKTVRTRGFMLVKQ